MTKKKWIVLFKDGEDFVVNYYPDSPGEHNTEFDSLDEAIEFITEYEKNHPQHHVAGEESKVWIAEIQAELTTSTKTTVTTKKLR